MTPEASDLITSAPPRLEVPAGPSWTPFPPELVDQTVYAAFARQVAAGPDRTAIAGRGGTLTYAEVDGLAGRAARGLVAAGATGRPVALAFEHDVALVVAILAVLRAGGVVLILDPSAPLAVNRAILADAEPAALVVDAAHAELADAVNDLAVQRTWEAITAADDLPEAGPADPAIGPDDPAMLAYSSGTTGDAKAAVLPHRALLQLFRGAIDHLKIGADDRLPMIFPVSLAVAAYPMFLPLMTGGSLRINDVRSNGLAGFPEWLAAEGVSVLYISPTVARFMGDVDPSVDLSALRLVVLGGERVDEDAVNVVRRVFGDHVTVANGYGTTETGVLTFYVIAPDEAFDAIGVPVGSPIAETELRILDDAGRPVPDGLPGDLFVRSRYLFSGYWKRPDLNEAVLGVDDGVAVYRTGDVGFIDAAGNLSLVGRSDAEVKVRGHRVHPGEIEQAMLSLPEVADVVVDPRPDARRGGGALELVAWIVPAAGVDLATVRAATKQVVRGPMVPARMVLLDALPQLPNGKLDRRALPDPAREGTSDAPVDPATPTEQRLLTLWQEILGIPTLGVEDDILALGAQSFDLAWAVVLIEERMGTVVPMSSLLEVQTVRELGWVVDDLLDGQAHPSPVVEVQPGAPDRPRLFVVHDLHGSAYGLRHLAPALGADQPVWGFESPFLEGRADGVTTLQDLGARYVQALLEVQPEGPYHLAGYSFGGVLAFEMALQLEQRGHEVAFLGIVDVGPGYRGRHYDPRKMLDKPWSRVPMPPDGDLPAKEQATWYWDLAKRSRTDLLYHLSLRTGLDRWIDPLQFRRDLRDGGRVPPHRRLWYAWRQHWELGRRYRWDGPRHRGDVLLIWANESAATDGTMGWGDVVDGAVDIVHVDVPHERMLQPDESVVIGQLLRDGLDRVLADR